MRDFEYVPMLNVDISYLIMQAETALEVINQIKRAHEDFGTPLDVKHLRADIRKALVGKAVSTRYNNNLYWVTDIDFAQNPECYFV